MTCKEKLRLDHPNWDAERVKLVLNCDCPSDHGYYDDCSMDCHDCWEREIPEKKTIYVKEMLTEDDVIGESTKSIYELIRESYAHALNEGIEANAIIINKNMVKVPEMFGRWPAMICGLNVYFTKDELPDNYSFAIVHDPNYKKDRLAAFESIGMEPDELRKAAEMYKRIMEVID